MRESDAVVAAVSITGRAKYSDFSAQPFAPVDDNAMAKALLARLPVASMRVIDFEVVRGTAAPALSAHSGDQLSFAAIGVVDLAAAHGRGGVGSGRNTTTAHGKGALFL